VTDKIKGALLMFASRFPVVGVLLLVKWVGNAWWIWALR